MTSFIHIVGPQGSGKSLRARKIVAELSKRGKTAIALVEEGWQTDFGTIVEGYAALRQRPYRAPYATEAQPVDVMIAEHVALPHNIDWQPGDRVIRIGGAT